MLLTQRKRRQILKVVLPLLIIVWAAMPGLPCCQAIAAAGTPNSTGFKDSHSSHGSSLYKSQASAEKASEQREAGSADKHSVADRDAPAQKADSDSAAGSCPDVDKNHHEVRGSASLDIAHIALVFFVPIPAALAEPVEPPGAPPPPIQRRPLHLSKSVLLI